jgi:hypothetical protein
MKQTFLYLWYPLFQVQLQFIVTDSCMDGEKEVPGINHHTIAATMAYYQRKEHRKHMLKHRSMYDGS